MALNTTNKQKAIHDLSKLSTEELGQPVELTENVNPITQQ